MYKSTATEMTYHYPKTNQKKQAVAKQSVVPLHVNPNFVNAETT